MPRYCVVEGGGGGDAGGGDAGGGDAGGGGGGGSPLTVTVTDAEAGAPAPEHVIVNDVVALNGYDTLPLSGAEAVCPFMLATQDAAFRLVHEITDDPPD